VRGGVRGGGFPVPAGEGSGKGAVSPPQKIFHYLVSKRRIWWISDALWRNNFEVVVCCAQDSAGCATNSVSFLRRDAVHGAP